MKVHTSIGLQVLFAIIFVMALLYGYSYYTSRNIAALPIAGVKAEKAGQWDTAIAIYQAALQKDPKQAKIWKRIADIQEENKKNTGQAISSLEQAVKIQPNDAELQFQLAQYYSEVDNVAQAKETIAKALRLKPDDTTYIKQKIELDTAGENYAAAQNTYNQTLATHPKDKEALLGLISVYTAQNLSSEAANAYLNYLDIYPKDSVTWLDYATFEANSGNFAAAFAALTQYQRRFSHNDQAKTPYLMTKAKIYVLAGQSNDALEILSPLLRDDPYNSDLLEIRNMAIKGLQAKIHRLIALKHAKAASDMVNALLEKDPDDSDLQQIKHQLKS